MKKAVFLFVSGLFFISILFVNFAEQVRRHSDEAIANVSVETDRKHYVENEWVLKVESETEAMNIALSNGLILKNVSKHGIAVFYGIISPFSVLNYNENNIKFQPNYLYYTQGVVIDDPGAPEQFALDHLDAYRAWQYSLGDGIVVAVIDTGIDYNHDEFNGNISPLSYNSYHEVVGLEAVMDDAGHGTAVAGVIAATQNNGIGISGIAPLAELLVIKANFDNEGYFSGAAIAEGIYYAVDNGAHVINMSLGGAYPDPVIEDACDYALSQGVIVVAAAGNDGLPIYNYPASFTSVISVGATTESKERASFSNFNRAVDISAPGLNVYSTLMGNNYGGVSGTSFSSPYVAGVIALLLSYYESETIEMVLNYLYASAEDLGSFGKDSFYGVGLVNAYDGLTITLRQVSFETFLGSELDPVYVAEGRSFYINKRPSLEGHYFAGWYKNIDLTDRFDFENEVIYEDTTLYAKYEEGESDNLDDYDYLINSDETVTILAYFGDSTELVIPSVFLGMPVVEIGPGAFVFNQTLTSIDVPDSVIRIGGFAFAYMAVIDEVIIGSGLEELGYAAFVGSESLTSVIITSELMTYLDEHTFSSCVNLVEVVLPDSITNIGSYAFENTFNLRVLEFPAALEVVSNGAFHNSGLEVVNLPDGVITIGNQAFAFAAYLKEFHFGSQLENIGERVFIGCASVELVSLHVDNVHFKIIDDVLMTNDEKGLIWYLPYNANGIYTLLETVEYVREGAFSNAKFEYFMFNSLLTHIPTQAFYQATKLKEIYIPDTIKSMGEYAFHNAYGLVSVRLPKDLERIPNGSFDRNIALKYVIFPENLRFIGGAAFVASGLEKVILPETVEVIESWAFTSCYILKEMYVPDGVKILQSHAIPSIVLEEMLPNLISIDDGSFNFSMMQEIILPESLTGPVFMRTSGNYDKTRVIDFGSAREILFISNSGSRVQELIVNEATERIVVEGESLYTPHIYIYGMDTELKVLFSSDYVVHAYQGSVAHQYAIDNGLGFVDLEREVVYHEVEINIDGPASTAYPMLVQDQELLHFKLDVLENHMVYEIKVNGKYIINSDRNYWVRVTEDIVVDVKIRPIYWSLESENLEIVDQVIMNTFTNSEYVNYPGTDDLDNPLLGFSDEEEFLTIIANDTYDTKPYRTLYHSNDVIHLSLPENVTHIPLLNSQFRFLKTIEIPEGVLTMSGFEELQELEYVILPMSLTQFPSFIDENDFQRGAFAYCMNLKAVVFKSSNIIEIPDYAFYFNPRLERIYLPTDIIKVGEYAFYNSISFKDLILINPLIDIADTAFMFKDYGYYYMGFTPLNEAFLKLPNFQITSMETNVLDYAEYYNIPTYIGERYYLAYLNDCVMDVYIEIVSSGDGGEFSGIFTKPANDNYMYQFMGWDQSVIDIYENTYTYAVFTEVTRQYLVRFIDPYNKEEIGYDMVSLGMAAEAPLNTDRDANNKYIYTFIGWNKDFSVVVSDLIVEAIYERSLQEYVVEFYDWDDNLLSSEVVLYGHPATEPVLPPKEFYTFVRWSEDFDYITKDLQVYPVRSTEQFYVTFFDFYGGWVSSEFVYSGQSLTPPVPLEIPGYIFIGWSENIDVVLSNLDIYPIYVQEDILLTYVFNEVEEIVVKKIATGQYSALVLSEDGRLYAFGNNSFYMLGSFEFSSINHPYEVTDSLGLSIGEKIIDIFVGGTHSLILTSENRVIVSGSNSNGQLGNGETSFDNYVGLDITSSFNFNPGEYLVDVALGEIHGIAYSNQGRVFVWGSNNFGQLGTGDTVALLVPTDITDNFSLSVGEEVIDVVAKVDFTGVLTSQGKLYLWGFNSGQLADGSFNNHYLPNEISGNFNLAGNEKITKISMTAGFGFALTSNNRIFAWGGGYYGNLSTGQQDFYPLPMNVTHNFNLDTGEYVEMISVGFNHGYALTSNNRVLSWGHGSYGQVGTGYRIERARVTDITDMLNLGDEEVLLVVAGNYSGYVVTNDNQLFGMGMNSYGQVGNYSNKDVVSPVLLSFNNFDTLDYLYNYGDDLVLFELDKEGYNFLGWFHDYHYTLSIDEDYVLTKDEVIYAGWEVKTFIVRFFDADGVLMEELVVEYGKDAIAPDNPIKEATAQYNYVFIGWDESYINVMNDLDIYPIFDEELRYYTVTFYNYDGVSLKSQFLPYGDMASPPEVPERMPSVQYSYLFSHWSEDFSFVESDLEIHAIFDEVLNEYLVTFLDHDGSVLKTEMVAYGSGAIAPDDPVKIGDQQYSYIFTGWDTSFDNIVGAIFVNAIYQTVVNQYKVTFYDDSGNIINEQMIPYGSGAVVPTAPVKDSTVFYTYTFIGWVGGNYQNVTMDLDITPTYDAVAIVYEYSLAPGVDTVYLDSSWLDGGINYTQINIEYEIEGSVNLQVIGNYQLIYILKVNDVEIGRLTRIVRVIEKPEEAVIITLNPGLSTLFVGSNYVEAGAVASYGVVNIIGSVDTTKPGVYIIEYQVNTGNNVYSRYRYVFVYDLSLDYEVITAYIVTSYKKEDEE